MKRFLCIPAVTLLFFALTPIKAAAISPGGCIDDASEYSYLEILPLKTEDGETINLCYDENGEYTSWYSDNAAQPENETDFPEYKGGTGEYYTSAEDIPLSEGEQLITADFDTETMYGRKYYIITPDWDNANAVYAGHEVAPKTNSPETGNTPAITCTAAAAAAIITVIISKIKKI